MSTRISPNLDVFPNPPDKTGKPVITPVHEIELCLSYNWRHCELSYLIGHCIMGCQYVTKSRSKVVLE